MLPGCTEQGWCNSRHWLVDGVAMGTAVITVLLSLSVLMNGVQSTRSMYVVLCMLVALQWFSHISLYLFILVMSEQSGSHSKFTCLLYGIKYNTSTHAHLHPRVHMCVCVRERLSDLLYIDSHSHVIDCPYFKLHVNTIVFVGCYRL